MSMLNSRQPAGEIVGFLAQLKANKATTVAVIASVALVLTNINSIIDNVEKLYKRFCTKEPNRIVVNYMRLTGAFEVPVFVQILSVGGLSSSPVPTIGEKKVEGMDVQRGQISVSLADFWKQSAYKDAQPITTHLWREVAKSGMLGHQLIYDTAEEDRGAQDLACALSLTAPEQLAEPSFRTKLSDDTLKRVFEDRAIPSSDFYYKSTDSGKPWKCDSNISKRVGFLFVTVDNPSKDLLEDVEVSYYQFRENALSTTILDHWLSLAPGDRRGAIQTKVESLKPSPQLNKMKVPNIRAGGKLIWLVSIYRADADNYEHAWLRPWDLPMEISYRVGREEATETLRLPNRRSVAPVPMPQGWYEQ